MNEERAVHGEFALMGYVESFGQQTLGDLDAGEVEEQLIDMLTDIAHFVTRQGLDWERIMGLAQLHIDAEGEL